MPAGYGIVDPEELPTEEFITEGALVKKLTEPLGCTELRINQVILEPGEETDSHTHPGQEELFVAQTSADIVIDGEIHEVPRGAVVRVREDVPRNLLNRTQSQQVWLAFGAPPVGGIDDFGDFSHTDP